MLTPNCPKCNSAMVLRKGKYGSFFGCTKYSLGCKGSLSYTEGMKQLEANKPEILEASKDTSKEYTLSSYQQAIIKAFQESEDSLVIEAVAGSGKSFIIVKLLSYCQKYNRVGFIAFNKDIVKALAVKVPESVYVSTLHSLGLKNITASWGKVTIEKNPGDKLKGIIKQYCENLAENLQKFVGENTSNIAGIVNHLKDYLLSPSLENIKNIAEKHQIILSGDITPILEAVEAVYNVSILIAKNQKYIDFSDMIYFPSSGLVPCQKFDVLMLDEAQDMNKAQISLILNSLNPNGRLIAVGDRNQSIYGFRGADIEAMENIIKAVDGKILPLSISYRCSQSVGKLVNETFPEISFFVSDSAKEGYTGNLTLNKFYDQVKPGDMIICRNNAPMVKPCYELIKRGIKAIIKGKEIGVNLVNLVSRIVTAFNAKTINDFCVALETYQQAEIEKLMSQNKKLSAELLQDNLDVISAMLEGTYTISELIDKINSLFDETTEGVMFSSVHKAKGLEADTVYLYKPELIPSKNAIQEWEKKQEYNLKYVAYTRAKENFIMVSE